MGGRFQPEQPAELPGMRTGTPHTVFNPFGESAKFHCDMTPYLYIEYFHDLGAPPVNQERRLNPEDIGKTMPKFATEARLSVLGDQLGEAHSSEPQPGRQRPPKDRVPHVGGGRSTEGPELCARSLRD